MSDQKEFVVIGWGLAGATLCWHLHQRGCKITVYDNLKNHSSRIAAGLANPVVFRRLTKSWQADTLLPYAKSFYREIENSTKSEVFKNEAIGRILASVEEQNNWSSLQGDERFKDHLGDIYEIENKHIKAPFGVGPVVTAGRLDVNTFLDVLKTYLQQKGVTFVNRPFRAKQVDEQNHYIYCSGYLIRQNIFFPHLRFKGTHGDILTIKAPDLKLDRIINKNIFILPVKGDLYTVGATYNWEMKEPEPTEEGKKELIEKLKAVTDVNFEVVSQKAGIRPTVPDRRPLLGRHPRKSNLYVFGGLGTKGVMIAPYYARVMSEYLIDQKPLPEEVDVKRFEKEYEKLINA